MNTRKIELVFATVAAVLCLIVAHGDLRSPESWAALFSLSAQLLAWRNL
jgi:hypothetical protein